MKCKRHGRQSNLNCDNILPSGLKCPYPICDQCWDYNESHEYLLPTQTHIYCYDCINNAKFMHHCETTTQNFAKSGKRLPDQIAIKDNNSKTKGDENNISLSVVNSDEVIDLSQIMSSQSSDESDYHSSNYDSNHRYNNSNSIDDVRIELSYDNHTDNLNEKVADSNEETVSCNVSKSLLDNSLSNIKKINLTLAHSEHGVDKSSDDESSDDNSFCTQYNTDRSKGVICERDDIDKITMCGNQDDKTDCFIDFSKDDVSQGSHHSPYNKVDTLVNSNNDLNNFDLSCQIRSPIYVPDWYNGEWTSNNDFSGISTISKKKNWITNDLKNEIESHYPSTDEIRINKVTRVCTRDIDAFKRKCLKLFPVGRIFMSNMQLDQAAKYFLQGWNCKKVHNSKNILCFYGIKGRKKTYVSKCAPDKRRKVESSMKTQYQCPFRIGYSIVAFNRKAKRPTCMYQVKVTICNPNHNCELSAAFYKIAAATSAGRPKLKLSGMNSLLHILKLTPSTSAEILRPLLKYFVHHDTPLDCYFIRNFRHRVAYYHAQNPDFQ